MLKNGDKVHIRTVTHYYTGEVVEVTKLGNADFIKLTKAAWIADTGRFSDALKNGTLSEIEPYPGDCFVAVAAVVDIAPWDHELPTQQK